MKSIDVFISYSQKNRDCVEKFAEELSSLGLSVWYDTNLEPGDSFVKTINNALKSAKTVLTVWSDDSVLSEWVIAESLDAFKMGKFSSIRIDNCTIPVPFNSSNYLQIEKLEKLSAQKNGQKLLLKLSKLSGNSSAALIAEVAEPPLSQNVKLKQSHVNEFKRFPKPEKTNPETKFVLFAGAQGAGASNQVIALACVLSEHKKVLVVDGSLNNASIDVLLGLAPEEDIATIIAGAAECEDAIIEVRANNHHFDVLPGRSGSVALLGIPVKEINWLISNLYSLEKYDVVIIDGSGCDSNVLRCYQNLADTFVVMVTDEPVSMTRAYSSIKACKLYNAEIDINIIVNKYSNKSAAKRTALAVQKACKTFLDFSPKLISILPNSTDVSDINRAQKPIIEIGRQHPYIVATAVTAVAVTTEMRPIKHDKPKPKYEKKRTQKEPTMEEILAQIRQIIADD